MQHHQAGAWIGAWNWAMATAWLLLLLAALLLPAAPVRAEEPPIPLRVIGSYDHTEMYAAYEEPFWTQQVPALTGGLLHPSIAPLDRAGIREPELFSLIRLGVLPVATVPLALATGDDPELSIVDLPALNPDLGALRRSLAQWRPHLQAVLAERYDIQLLALLTPTAQVIFCREPFAHLADVARRRVRVGSVAQGELIEALGGTALMLPLPLVVPAIRDRAVDCAITGSMPGNRIGLHRVTSHVSRLPVSWFVSAVAMNGAVWRNLPEAVRQPLQAGLARLETAVLDGAEAAIEDGFACDAGLPSCTGGTPGHMTVVNDRWDEAERRRLLQDVLLPRWVARCGADCATTWDRIAAPELGLHIRPPP